MKFKKILLFLFITVVGFCGVISANALTISDDGKYIYVSTRTEDVISVIGVDNENVKLLQVFSSEGLHPRDFILEKDCLIIANRLSNNLVSISLKDGLMAL